MIVSCPDEMNRVYRKGKYLLPYCFRTLWGAVAVGFFNMREVCDDYVSCELGPHFDDDVYGDSTIIMVTKL